MNLFFYERVYDLKNWKLGEWQNVARWDKDGITLTSTPIYWPGGGTEIPSDSAQFEVLFIDWKDPLAIVVMVLACLFVILSLVIGGVMMKFQETPVVKRSSPLFVYIIIFGLILGFCSVFPWIGEPSPASCHLRAWLVCFAFVLVYGPLFAKTWRIWKIFNNVKLRRRTITAQMLLAITGTIVAIQAVEKNSFLFFFSKSLLFFFNFPFSFHFFFKKQRLSY